jgi:hypothetical protein
MCLDMRSRNRGKSNGDVRFSSATIDLSWAWVGFPPRDRMSHLLTGFVLNLHLLLFFPLWRGRITPTRLKTYATQNYRSAISSPLNTKIQDLYRIIDKKTHLNHPKNWKMNFSDSIKNPNTITRLVKTLDFGSVKNLERESNNSWIWI